MADRFGMLLDVENIARMIRRAWGRDSFRIGAPFFFVVFGAVALSFSSPAPSETAAASLPVQSAAPQTLPTAPAQGLPQTIPPAMPRARLNIVVLDPAHG